MGILNGASFGVGQHFLIANSSGHNHAESMNTILALVRNEKESLNQRRNDEGCIWDFDYAFILFILLYGSTICLIIYNLARDYLMYRQEYKAKRAATME